MALIPALGGRPRRNPSGHAELLRWAGQYGTIAGCGVEGTGSYGPSWPGTYGEPDST